MNCESEQSNVVPLVSDNSMEASRMHLSDSTINYSMVMYMILIDAVLDQLPVCYQVLEQNQDCFYCSSFSTKDGEST